MAIRIFWGRSHHRSDTMVVHFTKRLSVLLPLFSCIYSKAQRNDNQEIVKTCADCGVDQNVGLDDERVSPELTSQITQVVEESNEYYQSLKEDYENILVLQNCQNKNEMCSFWKLQERCSGYEAYMKRECPLACQICHNEEFRARSFLRVLWEELPQVYKSSNNNNVTESRSRVLRHFMQLVGMDPGLLGQPTVTENWVQELHHRTMAVIPLPLRRLYSSSEINDSDFELLKAVLGTPQLVPYRSRGFVVQAMLDLDLYLTRPIQLTVGFAIPNESIQSELKMLSTTANKKILHMGAGAGYWDAWLRETGITEVVSYDRNPPARGDNAFFETDFSGDTVLPGSCTDILAKHSHLARESILLLIWPNDPDPVDNPQFCDDTDEVVPSEIVWDVDCLQAFVQGGGETVVYVGEREAALSHFDQEDDTQDSGLSGTRQFQRLLENNFDLVKAMVIPNWWLNEDDATIWTRRVQDLESSGDEL